MAPFKQFGGGKLALRLLFRNFQKRPISRQSGINASPLPAFLDPIIDGVVICVSDSSSLNRRRPTSLNDIEAFSAAPPLFHPYDVRHERRTFLPVRQSPYGISNIRHVHSYNTLSTAPEVDKVPFPCCPEDITNDWLTRVLQSEGAIDNRVSVTSFSSTRMGDGVGLLSLLHRVTLEYTCHASSDTRSDASSATSSDASCHASSATSLAGPKTLVAKFGHPLPEVRDLFTIHQKTRYERIQSCCIHSLL